MATITNLEEWVVGDKRVARFDIALGTTATGGVSLVPADIGFGTFDLVLIAPSAGVEYTYITSTKKIKALQVPDTSVVTGVITAPITVTQGGVVVSGVGATGFDLQVSNVTATGILGKTEATDRQTALATFGIPAPSGAIAPVFAGVSGAQGAATEITGTLSTAARCFVIGT